MKVSQHDHFALYVTDLDRSEKWYREVLGLEPWNVDVWWSDQGRFLGHGDAKVALFLKKPEENFSSKNMPMGNHQAFRVNWKEYEGFKEMLRAKQIPYREMDHTISQSLYIRDPDDYWIELTTYEV